MLLYLHLGSRITIMPVHTQTMQQTHMHKAVARHVKVKMLLSRPRQSDNSGGGLVGAQVFASDPEF